MAALMWAEMAYSTLDRTVYAPAEGARKGAHVLADLGMKNWQENRFSS